MKNLGQNAVYSCQNHILPFEISPMVIADFSNNKWRSLRISIADYYLVSHFRYGYVRGAHMMHLISEIRFFHKGGVTGY